VVIDGVDDGSGDLMVTVVVWVLTVTGKKTQNKN